MYKDVYESAQFTTDVTDFTFDLMENFISDHYALHS